VGSHFGFRFLRFAPVATRMSKGKSVFWETLPWGDPSRHAVVRMSNGESVSRGTLSEGGRQWTHCRGFWSFGKDVQGEECLSGDSFLGRSFLLDFDLVAFPKGRCLRESVFRETLLGRSLLRKSLGIRFTSTGFEF
jgi:hypothetical protein